MGQVEREIRIRRLNGRIGIRVRRLPGWGLRGRAEFREPEADLDRTFVEGTRIDVATRGGVGSGR